MGGKSGGGPSVPNYTTLAQEGQAQSEGLTAGQTYANRPTQTTPFLTSSWTPGVTTDPVTGQTITTWSQDTQFSPLISNFANYALEQAGTVPQLTNAGVTGDLNLQTSAGGPGTYIGEGGQIGNLVSSVGGANDYVADAERAYYDKALSRLDPQWDQRESELNARLASMGLNPGDAMSRTMLGDFGRERTDAYGQAGYDAALFGGQEASRLQGMDLAAGEFANAAQQQLYDQTRLNNEAWNMAQQLSSADRLAHVGFENQALLDQLGGRMDAANFLNQNAMMQQMLPLEQLSALFGLGGSMSQSLPGFTAASRPETADLVNAAQQGYLGNLQNQSIESAERSNFTSGLFGLGGTIAGAALGGPMGASIGGAIGQRIAA